MSTRYCGVWIVRPHSRPCDLQVPAIFEFFTPAPTKVIHSPAVRESSGTARKASVNRKMRLCYVKVSLTEHAPYGRLCLVSGKPTRCSGAAGQGTEYAASASNRSRLASSGAGPDLTLLAHSRLCNASDGDIGQMKIERTFTTEETGAYGALAFTTTASEIRNPDGKVVFS